MVNPSDASAVAQVSARIDKLFDGGLGHGETAASVAAPEGAKEIPSEWKLHPNQKIHRSKPGEEEGAIASLNTALSVMELPPYKEKYDDGAENGPAMVWTGLPSIWKLSTVREGGRQYPGDYLYVMDPSWITQVPSGPERNQLYVTKAVYFEKDGKQAVLVTYKYPRRARYFGNLLTLGAFDTDSGVPLEENLDAPMSSSSQLEKRTNDKLWTRLLLAAEGARVPQTRAFLLPHNFLASRDIPQSERFKTGLMPQTRAEVAAAVQEFLGRYHGDEVVVKPSGPRFHSGEGVKLIPRGNVDEIIDHVIALSHHPHMDSEGLVLLEQRLAPPPVYFRLAPYVEGQPYIYQDKKKFGVELLGPDEIAQAQPYEKKDSNERVWVARDENGQPYTVPDGFFRAGTWGKPTSGQPKDPRDAASIVPFEIMRQAWMSQHGVLRTQAEVDEFEAERRDIGVRALRAIAASEVGQARQPGEPHQAQTDMIGLDLMYQLENSRLVPYVIEVNDHDAAGQHAADVFFPDRAGAHSTVWVKGQHARAMNDQRQNP